MSCVERLRSSCSPLKKIKKENVLLKALTSAVKKELLRLRTVCWRFESFSRKRDSSTGRATEKKYSF